jgi:hypothetical protein
MNADLNQLLKQGDNPFENAFIRTPWDQKFVDVQSINKEVSDAVLKKMEDVRKSGLSRGVLLLGEPGFGKSHLLARIRTTDLSYKVIAFVEPPPSPERVLRHILRESIVRLGTAKDSKLTQLEWLSANFFVKLAAGAIQAGSFAAPRFHALASKWRGSTLNLGDLHGVLKDHVSDLVNHAIGEDPEIDASVLQAFFVLLHESKPLRTLAMRWLRGDILADEDLKRLGIAHSTRQLDAEGGEDQARRTIRQMLKVCRAADKVMVLCVDQIEEVNDGPAAKGTGIRALAEALSNLVQYEGQLLVLTACLRDRWESYVGEYLNRSQVDRVAQTTITLKPMVYDQAVELIQRRLDDWTSAETPKVPAGAVFDLDALKSWMEKEVVVHPRGLILHCCGLLEEYRDGAIDLPLKHKVSEAPSVPIDRRLKKEVEDAQRLRSGGLRRLGNRGSAAKEAKDAKATEKESPMPRSLRDKNDPNQSLDPVGWYFGMFEQTVRDLQADPARDVKNIDEQDLAATVHELLHVLSRRGTTISHGQVAAVQLGRYIKHRRYYGNCLEISTMRANVLEKRGIVFSSADHFQSIRALLEHVLQAMEETPGFFIRTIPLRNTYRKSREIMNQLPLGSAFIMEDRDFYPLIAAQKLRRAAAASDLSMGPKVVSREDVDRLLVRSGVLEENRVIRTAFLKAPRLAKKKSLV